jgi:2-oxoglutarate dehydrogenase E2 component (dihydrolipoamide succinyltransferase)
MAMQDAMIVEWVKQVGDAVAKGEVLLRIETEKVVEELEAPESGVLAEILVPVDAYADVDTVLARIRIEES